MPDPVLLDGSNAAIDITIDGNSHKCVFAYVSADLVKEFTEKTTFCNEGWRSRTPGMKQLQGRAEGFLSINNAASDPSAAFEEQDGVPIVITFTTGLTYTFTGHVARSHAGVRAAANSEFALDFESDGAVTVVADVS